MIAFEAKPSWLWQAEPRQAMKKGRIRLSRSKVSAILLGGVVATLVAAGATPPAFAAPSVASAPALIDQASWASRKQVARLSNGIDMAFVELGDPQGTPVVLLHGYTDTSRLWTILAPRLSGYRLLIPDQRGHGASSKPECCYAPTDLAHDVKLFLDAMMVKRAAIVGSSMGSMVAQLFAAEHPDRTSAIVLAGSTALPPLTRDQPLFATLTSLEQPANGNASFLREWSPSASPTPVDAAFLHHFDREMADVPVHVWRSVIRELAGYQVARHSPDVQAPVLILSGGKDPLFGPEHHAALIRAYPRAESHVLADLGHNLVVERPSQVGGLLADFLARNAARTR